MSLCVCMHMCVRACVWLPCNRSFWNQVLLFSSVQAICDVVFEDKSFCLKEVDGLLKLDHLILTTTKFRPSYFVCGLNSCDFCVCTFVEDHEGDGLYIEHIYKDQRFWVECVTQAEYFFKTCLLPEIVGKWYTRDSIGTIILYWNTRWQS